MILDSEIDLTLRPMKYPQFFKRYKDSIKNIWTTDEIDFSMDFEHLRDRISPNEAHLIRRLVAFFATADNLVAHNLVLNFYKHINSPEYRMFLGKQLFDEMLHVEAYLTKPAYDEVFRYRSFIQINKSAAAKNGCIRMAPGRSFVFIQIFAAIRVSK